MPTNELDAIVDLLDRQRQRATYGAVAQLLGRSARSLMTGRPKDQRNSWIVNQRTERPSDYEPAQMHPALMVRAKVLTTATELTEWLTRHDAPPSAR